jgi:hypothetical protein
VNGGDERKLFVVLMYFVSANEHAAVIYFRESDTQVRKGEIRTQISTVKGGRLPQLLSLRANALLDFGSKGIDPHFHSGPLTDPIYSYRMRVSVPCLSWETSKEECHPILTLCEGQARPLLLVSLRFDSSA